MSKPQEILELEKVYNISLTETKEERYITHWDKKNLYLLNANAQVIGLNLRENGISEIKSLEKFTQLEKLSLAHNRITKIENLEKLTNLSELDISYNQISKIENLENLINLIELSVSHNKISKIENLEKLTSLTKLYLNNNQISKIENLEKLTNLSNLILLNNQISKIENLDFLTTNSHLNIGNNKIFKIQHIAFFLKNKNLRSLYIGGNPFAAELDLNLKPNNNNLAIIKSELQKLQEQQTSIQLPVKVMLLGNHFSGKSTLLKYLQTKQCTKIDKNKNSSTHVLSVQHSKKTINYELPKAIYYDFGGQDYYHGIYQAFFTNEAFNLLVWNPKSDSNILLESDSNKLPTRNYNRMYWLAQLQYSFLKRFDTLEKYDDPLLLIQTHADENKAKHNWNEAFNENNVVDEFHVSLNADSKTSRNTASLQYLTATFWDVVENQSSKKEVPKWYPEFLSYILNKKNDDAISLDTIVKYYKREELSLAERKKYLREDLEQLARKGMLLYYKNDEDLNDVAWLNPAATVAKIHDTILNKENIEEYKGKLTTKEFQKLDIPNKIERLLRNEKVLFFDKGNDEYIIPNYLPLTSEDAEVYDLLKFDFNKPTFVLKFERFIPFGLINQLICHYGQNPDKKHYWRDQLIFTLNDRFKVWIQLDFSKLTISVSINPQTTKDPTLNDCIRTIFMEIILLYWGRTLHEKIQDKNKEVDHRNEDSLFKKKKERITENTLRDEFNNLKKPEDLYLSTDGEHFVHYNTLDNSEKTQEQIQAFPMKENQIDLDKTAGRTQRSYKYRNFTNNKNIKKMKKIFISYSRKDVEYKDELRKHLNMLKIFDVADNWSCEDITIGKWHDQIQKELEESDLVIFMLSINFFNSQYILDKEVINTMNAIAEGSPKKVLCVIVSKFPGLENFDESTMNSKQKSILKLASFQYASYHKEKNETTSNLEEYIINLKEAKRKGILDEQLTKIVEKVMKDI
ncbi:leucine-rich repeat domain-containing protein [Kordia sp. YSTF-M3]|uniref:Leucine-rich repeat domain-containing protein n=1 Tax=Kordia aestuariivivens TaxID=2759037 RepID=A0ABR7Q4V9_9FLAO|nr:leucine-rich repeat domain-containing protein [Kordia aestuariivivens]MBC8753582.1 leucine-rich repeat domain-containing protein [Kordia aestuariivivens]